MPIILDCSLEVLLLPWTVKSHPRQIEVKINSVDGFDSSLDIAVT